MALAAGTRLGAYEIVSALGAGGMGEVYRARDSKLGREVAVKLLPDGFAEDPERVARLRREAQMLAALDHPNIAAIHGLEEAAGVQFLVLELVAGDTLAARLAAGPLPVPEALQVGRQIAEALEAAHGRGIVHRDLKPDNIKVTPEGKVKVLDFGLAKDVRAAASTAASTHSPTLEPGATAAGVILGTAAYMSPEQARGRPVDKRTDIWAFGCVLYEALSGRQAFGGETVSDSIARILAREPDWTPLPAGIPPTVQTLLRRCLQKETARRLQDIGDARIEIEESLSAPTAHSVRATPAAWWRLVALVMTVAALVLGADRWRLWRVAPVLRQVARLVVPLPAGDKLSLEYRPALALSPDGTRLVYAASRGGRTQLFLRPLDRFEASAIPHTEGASGPFFSPNGESVGFFAGGKLKTVSLGGGAPVTVCDAPDARGAAWAVDGAILFSSNNQPGLRLSRVTASGGKPERLAPKDVTEIGHRWPGTLPGGNALLFTGWRSGMPEDASIGVLSLPEGSPRTLIEGGSDGHYCSGYVVFHRAGGLVAAPFDSDRLEIGAPVPVLDGVNADSQTGSAQFSLSRDGTLAYVAGGLGDERSLLWVDRKGMAVPASGERRNYRYPRLSPDGRWAVVRVNYDLWIWDSGNDSLKRLTFAKGYHSPAVWTHDGRRVVYFSNRERDRVLFWKATDGSGPEERLASFSQAWTPTSVSPDGKWLAFDALTRETGGDIWLLPLEGVRKPQPLLETPFSENGAEFSPDGRWIAYTSDESGRRAINVVAFPGTGAKWEISTDGGWNAVWRRDGRELFYQNGERLMAVEVTTSPTFSHGKPRLLFEGPYQNFPNFLAFDIAPDGQRFMMIRRSDEASAPTEIHVVLNWIEEVKRRLTGGRN